MSSGTSGSTTPTHPGVPPLSDKAIATALQAINIAGSGSDTPLAQVRQTMQEQKLIPHITSPSIMKPGETSTSTEPMNWAEDTLSPEEMIEESANFADCELPPEHDTSFTDERAEQEIEEMLCNQQFTQETPLAPTDPVQVVAPQSRAIDPAAIATVKDLGLLYTGMKDGVDKTLVELHDIKLLLFEVKSECRSLREHQVSLAAKLADISSQVGHNTALQCSTQVDLAHLKTEMGICTVGFSKINSALLEMNQGGIPIGKIPERSKYLDCPAPVMAGERSLMRATPLDLKDDSLVTLLEKMQLDAVNLNAYCELLNNRTANYFAKVFPSLFPGVPLVAEPAQKLLKTAILKEPSDYIAAIKHVKELIALRNTGQRQVATRPVPSAPPLASNAVNKTTVKKTHAPLPF